MLCSDFDPDRKAVINPEDNFSPLPGFPQMCMGVYSQPIVESLLQRFGGEEILALRFCSGPVPVYRSGPWARNSPCSCPMWEGPPPAA